MARMTLTVNVGLRWWAWPYFRAAQAFGYIMRPFVSDDDLEEFAQKVGSFIGRHGVYFKAPKGTVMDEKTRRYFERAPYGHTINDAHMDDD